MANLNQGTVNKEAFETACGVGVIITSEMIETEVTSAISKVKDEIKDTGKNENGLILA